jgi:glycosyltransferase involved in cell wall biosynthesis
VHAADVTDLLWGFRHVKLPSGVSRVQTRLLTEGAAHFTLVAHDARSDTWRQFPRAELDRLLEGTRDAGDPKDPAWQAEVGRAEDALHAAPEHPFRAGDWLLGIGAAWWLPGHPARIMAARDRQGVRYASFVHDLIPLTVPEHVAAELVRGFVQHFASLCLLADHVVCVSETARREFLEWRPRLLPGVEIPADVLRLDARFGSDALAVPGPAEPYVLAVGSVESRKNQLGLLRAWLRLVREHGEAAVPRLIVAGIAGWQAEPVQMLLDSVPALRRRVEWRRIVRDEELRGLYEGCLFTVFNSLAEGWGLPVTESITYGKVPLCADTPALRESGGRHAVFVEAENVPALAAAAWALITDPVGRAAREAAIQADPGLGGWADVAARCAGFLDAAPPVPRRERLAIPLHARLPAGIPPMPELPALPPLHEAGAALLRAGPGWSHQEEWGAWAVAPGPARLRLPMAPELAGAAVTLVLETVLPPPGHRGRVRQAGGLWESWVLPEGEGELRLEATVPDDGLLVVELDVGEGVAVPGDPRRLGLGLRALRVVPTERPLPSAAPPAWWKRLLRRG